MASSPCAFPAHEPLPYIPLQYSNPSPEESTRTATELVYALRPEWKNLEGELEIVRFTDGITNTVSIVCVYGDIHYDACAEDLPPPSRTRCSPFTWQHIRTPLFSCLTKDNEISKASILSPLLSRSRSVMS